VGAQVEELKALPGTHAEAASLLLDPGVRLVPRQLILQLLRLQGLGIRRLLEVVNLEAGRAERRIDDQQADEATAE